MSNSRTRANSSNYSPKGPHIYKANNLYRVRVSVDGVRNDEYVNSLREAKSIRKMWLNSRETA